MPSQRTLYLQPLLRGRSLLQRSQQRRWAQVHDVRFIATHRDPNNVFDKYREKLAQKAKQEGHDSVESLKEAYKDKVEDLRRQASTPITPGSASPAAAATAPKTATDSAFQPPPPPRPQTNPAASIKSSTNETGIKPLSSYLDVDKVASLPPKEIEALWRLRHVKNPYSICACIPLDTYKRIASTARQYPQFVLPLPRETEVPFTENNNNSSSNNDSNASSSSSTAKGAEVHFLQWSFHPPASVPASSIPAQPSNTHTSTVIFTNLAAYKLHGSFAEPHTTITHHLDLADEKGLVFMHGQIMPERGVSAADASWLANCVQRFYDFGGQASPRKGELLQLFSRGDLARFRIEDLMEESEKL